MVGPEYLGEGAAMKMAAGSNSDDHIKESAYIRRRGYS